MASQPPLKWSATFSTLVLTAALLTLTATPAGAAPTTYRVDKTDPNCSNAGAGTFAQPFCTIGKAASLAAAGDTVRVVAGTYAETVNGPNSGTAGNPITYSAAPGVTVTGNGSPTGAAFRMTGKSYIVIKGFAIANTVDYGIFASGSDHITITDVRVSSAGSPVAGSTRVGIYLNNTNASTITGNTTDHNSGDGIRLTHGSSGNRVSDNVSFANAERYRRNATGIQVTGAGSNNNTIIHNITYANEDSGLQFYSGAQNNHIIGNLSYGNGDHGIDNNAAPNNEIVGNTIQGNVTAGINLEGATPPGSGGATLANNIAVDNGLRLQVGGGTASGQAANIRVDARSIAGTTMDYDQVYLNSGTVMIQWDGTNYASLAAFKTAVPGAEAHGHQAHPLFADPAPIAQRPAGAPFNVAVHTGDYHLIGGSPAIDSADSGAPNEPSLDIEGTARVDDPATVNTGAGPRKYDDRGAYEFVPAPTGPPPTGNDLNGDGNADIVWRSKGGVNRLWTMDGTTRLANTKIDASDPNWQGVGIGDFNGDGMADLLWRNTTSGANRIYLMNGATITSNQSIPKLAYPKWKVVGVGDLNGDGNADIVWRSKGGVNRLWTMDGTTRLANTKIDASDPNWQGVGIGDFNGDGMADLLWRNTTSGANRIYLMNGATITSNQSIPKLAYPKWKVVGVGDLNGDGNADIVWRSKGGVNRLWTMDGTTRLANTKIDASDPNWQGVGIGDFNGDGMADLLWRNTTSGANRIYLMNGATITSNQSIPKLAYPKWKVVPGS